MQKRESLEFLKTVIHDNRKLPITEDFSEILVSANNDLETVSFQYLTDQEAKKKFGFRIGNKKK